jgi:hypothetical protein
MKKRKYERPESHVIVLPGRMPLVCTSEPTRGKSGIDRMEEPENI